MRLGPGGEFGETGAVAHEVDVVGTADYNDGGCDAGVVEETVPGGVTTEGDAEDEVLGYVEGNVGGEVG